jgi:YYY domain-containing protein
MSQRLASLRTALRPHLIPILLLATLLAAAALRFYALDWDRGHFFHPDERAIMEATVKVGLPVPFKLSALFTPQSPLNPKFFAYGSLPFYLTKATASFLGLFRHNLLEYGNIRLVGRAYSVLFDLGTIVLIYLLGKKLYDRRAGLLAAVFVTFSVLHIQLAHFYAVDGVLTFFIVLAVYWAVDVMRTGSLGRSALLGASVGLALASKFSAAPVLLTIVVAWAIYVIRGPQSSVRSPQSVVPGQTAETPSAVDRLAKAIIGLTIAGICFLVVFFIGEPYAFIDWASFIKRIIDEGRMARGSADLPYTRQYINTPAYLYQIKNALLVSYGLPLGLAAFAGLAWATLVAIFRRRSGEIVVLSWVLVYFAIDGAFQVKFLRYMLPLLPFLSLFGAQAMLALYDYFARARKPVVKWSDGQVVKWSDDQPTNRPSDQIEPEELPLDWEERLDIDQPDPPAAAEGLSQGDSSPFVLSARRLIVGQPWQRIGGWLGRYGPAIAQALIALVVVSTMFYALAFLNIYRQQHPWIQISEWIYRHVPKGAVRATEHWDDHLPLGLVVDGQGRSEGEYPFKEMPLYEDDNPAKLNLIIERLRSVDYVILATNRLYGSIARLPDRYPITTEYYRLLFEEKLGFKLVGMAATYPSFLGVSFVDDTTVDPPLPEPPLLADFRPSPLVIHLGRVDESFTVYDHPKPLVFQKVQNLSDAELRALFAPALSRWDELNRQKQAQAEQKQAQAEQKRQAARGKTLLLDEALRRAQEAGGTFSAIFHRNDLANRLPVLVWWLAVQVLGLLAFPVAFVVFRGLHDRGYVLAKSLGILLVAYPVWLLASLRLLAFGRLSILLFMAVLALVSGLLAYARRQELAEFWRQHRRLILGGEVLFLAAYLAFVGIRLLNPDLWQPWFGGEKPMEFAFLNAITKSTYFPPYDPYYAGGYINYYYYGQYLIAFLIRLTGIVPTVAFNVAVPMLFALTVVNAFSITYNLVRGTSDEGTRERGNEGALIAHPSSLVTRHSSLIPPSFWALLGALFVAAIGNLTVPIQIGWGLIRNGASTFKSTIPGLEPLVKIGAGLVATYTQHRGLPPFDYWDLATRIIPNTINEFPFFSFLFADLHPHMIGIPFTLLVLALALGIVRESSVSSPHTSSLIPHPLTRVACCVFRSPRFLVTLFCLSIALGSLVAINSWDLPTYLGVVFCALLIQQWVGERRLSLVGLALLLVRFAIIVALSLLLYLPFFQSYQALIAGLGLVRSRTPLLYYLAIHGFFIVVLTTFLLAEAGRERRSALLRLGRLLWRRWDALPRLLHLARRLVRPAATFHLALWGLAGLLVLVLLFVVLRWTIFVLLVPLLVLTIVLALRRQATADELFTLLLLFTGLLISLGVEVVFLRDFLAGGDVYRMNTIFKFYIQIWIFFALASAVGLSRLAERLPLPLPLHYQGRGEAPSLPLSYQGRGEGRGWRTAWLGLFAFLLVAVLLYPVLGIPARVNQRFPGARPPVGTLDGAAFMSVGSYTFDWQGRQFKVDLSYDYEAIRWLQDNVPGSPVIAEARVDYYREFGMRVSSFTGLPTLLGAHQGEQRYDTQVGQRDGEARTFFNEPDFAKVLPLIDKLHIKYIYVGQLERGVYSPQGLAKFDAAVGQYLDLVYENPKVKIYRVK